MKSNQREKYNSLDGLRAYSAIGIAMMHFLANIKCGPLSWNPANGIIEFFTNYVYLFFMVSAFSMCCGYYERVKNGQVSMNEFYAKRYKRIWPYFALLCLIGLAFDYTIGGVWQTFADLTLCFNLLPNPDIQIIGVGWFLGLVFLFYIMFPFFTFLINSKKRAWFVLAVAIAFHFIGRFYFFKEPFVDFEVGRHNMVFSMPYFLVGGIIYLYRRELKTVGGQFHRLLFLICMVASIFEFFKPEYIDEFMYLIILFGLWMLYAISGEWKWLSNKVVKYLSGISMEIYLSHMVLFRLTEKMGLDHITGNSDLNYIIATVVTLAMTIGFCHVVKYKFLPKVMGCIKNKKINENSIC